MRLTSSRQVDSGVTIASIVEGKGEVEAVPLLLRRVALRVSPDVPVRVLRPIRVPRNRILKDGQLERNVELAARAMGRGRGGILILLDADDCYPKRMAEEMLRRANAARSDRHIRVVLAKREYEAWFLAAARSLARRRGIDGSTTPPTEPESISGAKEWLGRRMPPNRAYSPTRDQPALTEIFDMDAARSAPSFDKLWRDVEQLLGAALQTPHA